MKNYLLILGIISVFLVSACSQQPESAPTAPQPAVIEAAEDDAGESPEVPSPEPVQAETRVPPQADSVSETIEARYNSEGVLEIDMIARQWEYIPPVISVFEGDKVKLNIRNVDVTHGFSIFEFGVNEKLTPGKTTAVEFTADKAGDYTFLCSVPCGRGHSGMNGKLIVLGRND